MSIDQQGGVDSIGKDLSKNEVVLTISDHLEWGDNEHLLKLQEKLNAYLSFLESGEIYEAYPDAEGASFVIDIICKYDPDPQGKAFLDQVEEIVSNAGFGVRWSVL